MIGWNGRIVLSKMMILQTHGNTELQNYGTTDTRKIPGDNYMSVYSTVDKPHGNDKATIVENDLHDSSPTH